MSKQYDVAHLIELGRIDSDNVWRANQNGNDLEYNTHHMLSESQIAVAAMTEYARLKKCSIEEASQNLSLRFFSTLDARNKEKDLDIIFTQPLELERLFDKDNAVLINVAYGGKPELIALHGNNHYTLAALMPDGDGKIAVEYYNSIVRPDPELGGLDAPHMLVGRDFCDKTIQYIQGQGFGARFVDKSVDQQLDNNCGLCVASNAAHRAANLPAEKPRNKRDWTLKLGAPTFHLIEGGQASYLNAGDAKPISAAAGKPHIPPRPAPQPQKANTADKPFAGIFGRLGDDLAAAGEAYAPRHAPHIPQGQNLPVPSLGQIFGDLEDYIAAAAVPDIPKLLTKQKQPATKPVSKEDQEVKEVIKRSLQDSQFPKQEYDFDEINEALNLADRLFKGYSLDDDSIKRASFSALSEIAIPKITNFIEQEFKKEHFKYDKNNLGTELSRYINTHPGLPSDRNAFNQRLMETMDSIQAIQLQNLEERAREVGAGARGDIVHGGAGASTPQAARPVQQRGRH